MRFLLLAALVAASIPFAAPAAGVSLTLAEAQRLAVERSRALQGRRHAISAAREMAIAAGQLPDPVLTVALDNVPAEGDDKFRLAAEAMTMKRVAVMQELTRGDKRRLRARRYELEARRGVAEEQAALASIQRDTALAWIDAAYAEAMASVLAEQRLRALQEAQAAEAEYRAGRSGQPGVLRAHGSLAMLDDRAAEEERRVATARTMLARWTGLDAAVPLAALPDMTALHLEGHDLDDELAKHPEIEALAMREQVALVEGDIARAERDPDWRVEVAYGERSSRFGDMFSVGFSVPLPWDRANRQDRALAAKRAAAEQAGAERDEMLRQHVAEVRAMVQEWRSHRTRLARFEREIVPIAENRAEAAAAAYGAGRSGPSELLAARRAVLEARLQALQVEAEAARLWARLSFLVPREAR